MNFIQFITFYVDLENIPVQWVSISLVDTGRKLKIERSVSSGPRDMELANMTEVQINFFVSFCRIPKELCSR